MGEVQETIDRIKASLDAFIPKSTVNIVPTSTGTCSGAPASPTEP